MSTLKIITIINWILISTYGAFILWAILQKVNPNNDAGGGEQEATIKAVSFFLLLVLIGLNLTTHLWIKIMILILVSLLLLLIRYIVTH